MYKVLLICIVIWGSLTGQGYVDEVLHPHYLQIYQTVGNNLLFQQANASIAAIWQGTVCKLIMSYPLTGLLGPDPSLISHPWDILGQRVHEPIPSQLPHFPNLNTSWLKNGNAFHEGVGLQPKASFKHEHKSHRMHL